jgi:hypothetical protein
LNRSFPIRFAVGIFESWPQFYGAVDDLLDRGLKIEQFSCVALQHVFSTDADDARITTTPQPVVLEFAENRAPIACTVGPFCDRLQECVAAGSRSLKEALGCWLIRRHAAHFAQLIDQGKIQLWIKLLRPEEERSAYESLLANSSNSVGVHDLTSP